MNKVLSYRRGLLLASSLVVVLAACNSITGVNDLKVGLDTAAAGTGGAAGAGGANTGAGAGGDGVSGAAGSVVDPQGGAKLGEACSSSCVEGLVCLFGKCRTPCESDAGCPGTNGEACLTDTTSSPARGGCRFPSETCKAGDPAPVPPLVCGPGDDGFARTACQSAQQCRADQHCIQGSCISPTESVTKWGKCGEPGKTCVGANLTACDVGATPGSVNSSCASAELCQASIPGTGTTCAVCSPSQARCGVDGSTNAVSADKCNANLSGFDSTECTGATSQCNPTTAQCLAIPVDAHEVTRGEYAAFVTTVGADTSNTKLFPAACVGNVITPDAGCMAGPTVCKDPTDCAQHPQVCVDWCDAFAYCASRGQHLCGKIGTGAMVPFDDFADPGVDEWSNACTVGGRFEFGLDFADGKNFAGQTDGQKCNLRFGGTGTTVPVDTLPNCGHKAVGYETERHMLGNVREWENSCKKEASASGAGSSDLCHTRDVSFAEKDEKGQQVTIDAMRCANGPDVVRSHVAPDLGFRCCGNPTL